MNIKTLSTTQVREQIKDLVDAVAANGRPIVIGRRNRPEAVLIPFPAMWNGELSEMTNINAYSRSFDFLAKEPDLYSVQDLKNRHA